MVNSVRCVRRRWQQAGSRAQLDGRQRVFGPKHPVFLTRDALGTATITGPSRDDVTYALGYVHARERFYPWTLCVARQKEFLGISPALLRGFNNLAG